MVRRTSTYAVIATLVASVLVAQQDAATDSAVQRYGSWGVDLSGMDRSVRPGDNFAMFAFGRWYRDTPLPPGRGAMGPRMEMEGRNDARIASVVEGSARRPTARDERLIANLYSSYLNTARIERLDATPLRKDLTAIKRLSNRTAIARHMGSTLGGLGQSFFNVSVGADYDAPQRTILRLQQPALGAGRRDVYLNEEHAERVAAYRAHVARLLQLAGWDDPEQFARKIVELETRIAQVSWNDVDSNDRSKTWNVTTLSKLEASAPAFPWRAFLAGAGLGTPQRFIVFQNTAFPRIAAIFGETPAETLKAWLAFYATDAAAPYLSSRFRESAGARAREAVNLVNDNLRDAVARQYMTRYFRPEARAQVETMVTFIKAAMAERIRRLDWMSPQTKEAALQKLVAIRVGIGYPDRWRDYSGLRLRADDLYGNMRRLAAFDWARETDKLRRPVDRDAWDMAPQAVGAQAAQPRLFMLFTAGLLQPPIFDPHADPAVNFGGLGAVIGHEIGHFFDDNGWRIDATGARRSWWAPEDAAQFEERTERLVRQLERVEASPGVRVDARRTLSEFMAHLEGLEVALDAYHASLGDKPAPILDGFTGDQRFFLAFAQTWKAKVTDEFWRRIEDQAPPIVTINGVLRNIDEWYTAFDVKPSDANYLKPEDRIRIW
jgi:putative endopeptidase